MIIFYIIIFLMATFIILAYYLSGIVIYPKTISIEETIKKEIELKSLKEGDYEKYTGEENYVRSEFGYDIFIKEFTKKNSKGTVLILHGITYTHVGSVKLVKMFLKYGMNVIITDLRNHGKSGGRNTTYGYYEKYDTKKIIDYIVKKYGDENIVGIHGTSMGGAIALETVKIDSRIDFVISDCAYSDLERQLIERAREDYNVYFAPLYNLAKFFAQKRAKFEIREVSPVKRLENINTKILFIHGIEDKYINKNMAVEMYEKNKNNFSLYLVTLADHAMAYTQNITEYEVKVYKFLDEVLQKK